MPTFRHVAFTGARVYADHTVIAGCETEGEAPPSADFVPCEPELLAEARHLWTEKGVRYLGWL